jgi:hypothetical protein
MTARPAVWFGESVALSGMGRWFSDARRVRIEPRASLPQYHDACVTQTARTQQATSNGFLPPNVEIKRRMSRTSLV